MTLSELANLGEILGAIAVVASLVYLAVQVRQNTRAVRGSTLHLNTDLWATLFNHLSEPGVAQAYVAGMSGRADIKPLHYTQFYFVCKTMFLALEDQFYQARQGTLDPEIYAAYERATSSQMLAFHGFRIWWQQTRSTFSPTFALRIDEMIAAQPKHDSGVFLEEWQRIARGEAPGDA